MTKQIADFLMERLKPRGVGVVIEASHLCAVMRGVRKPGTIMTTSHVLGLFRIGRPDAGRVLQPPRATAADAVSEIERIPSMRKTAKQGVPKKPPAHGPADADDGASLRTRR